MGAEMQPTKNMRKCMDEDKRRLFLIRGLPGSGKSTLAARHENWDHRVLETDMFMVGEDGSYNFDPKKLQWAHRQCLEKTLEFLDQGFDVSVANTFTRLWEMQPYLEIPMVDITVIEMKTQYKNIHGVGNEIVERMRERWEELPADFKWPVVRFTKEEND